MKRSSYAQEKLDAAADVLALRPPGTTLTRKGRKYVVGCKQGHTAFWMMCLDPPHKALVDARSIMKDYEKESVL